MIKVLFQLLLEIKIEVIKMMCIACMDRITYLILKNKETFF